MMDMPTVDEWLKALGDAEVVAAEDDEGKTRAELQRAWDCSAPTAQRRIRALYDGGHIILGRRRIERLGSGPTWAPVYRLEAATK